MSHDATENDMNPVFEPLPEFRAKIRAENALAFALASDAARTIADAVLRPISLPSEVERALDILMQQAWQAHSSVCILVERCYFEDAHTIQRRLLEIGAQLAYIASPADSSVRQNRAIRFLARLWHSSPPEIRSFLPDADRKMWEDWYLGWKSQLSSKPQSWWPTIRELLSEVGHGPIYDQDYRFLCGIAHGAPSLFLHDYSGSTADRRLWTSPSVLLVHATRYYITAAFHWNSVFKKIPATTLNALSQRAVLESA